VVDALRRRDAAAAGQAMRDHVLPNQHFIVDSLISSPVLRATYLAGAT
jgi:DNA-binding GntR family transcriptional regulator